MGQTGSRFGSHQAIWAEEPKADRGEVHHAANEEAKGTHGRTVEIGPLEGQASLPSDERYKKLKPTHEASIGSRGVADLGGAFNDVGGGRCRIAPSGQPDSAHAVGGTVYFQKGAGGWQSAEGVIHHDKPEALIDQNHGANTPV